MFRAYFLKALNLYSKISLLPWKSILAAFAVFALFCAFAVSIPRCTPPELEHAQNVLKLDLKEQDIVERIDDVVSGKETIRNSIRQKENKKPDADVSLEELDKFYDEILN